MKNNKIFLFDVDGVLLECWPSVHRWLEGHYSRKISPSEFRRMILDHSIPYEIFFSTPPFGELPAKRGMKTLVKTLRKNGYDLGIITAIPPEYTEVRRKNLTNIFGDVFVALHCVGDAPKSEYLKNYARRYKEVIFCDDHPRNIRESIGITTTSLWLADRKLDPSGDIPGAETIKTARDIARLLTIAP